jgi:hypothetical protein
LKKSDKTAGWIVFWVVFWKKCQACASVVGSGMTLWVGKKGKSFCCMQQKLFPFLPGGRPY